MTLPDGRVLVVAGCRSGQDVVSVAELYEPAADAWQSAGELTAGRCWHTATLLADGRVLVVGGYNGTYLASAEVYDPATNVWTATGDLSAARAYHAAVLLRSGEVLVTGGSAGSRAGLETETYDPPTGAWALTGTLPAPYEANLATILDDGSVLITGRADEVEPSPAEPSVQDRAPAPGTPRPPFAPTPTPQGGAAPASTAVYESTANIGRTAAIVAQSVQSSTSNFTKDSETARLYGVHQVSFELARTDNPHARIVTVTFTLPHAQGETETVHAFYDGLNATETLERWRARVYVSRVGLWHWSTPDHSGEFTAEEALSYRLPGMLRVSAETTTSVSGRVQNGNYTEAEATRVGTPKRWYTDDGRTFLPMADTAYRLFFEWRGDVSEPRPPACPTRPYTDTAQFVRDYADAVVSRGINVLRVEALGTWAYTDAEITSRGEKCKDAGGANRLCKRQDDCNADLSLFWSADEDAGTSNDLFSGGPTIPFTMTMYPNLQSFQRAEEKLIQLLNEQPGLYLQMMLMPEPLFDADDVPQDHTWLGIESDFRHQMWRTMVARWAAFPNVFWSVSNDLDNNLTNNHALVNEVGCYFGGTSDPTTCGEATVYNPWRSNRPVSAGNLRKQEDYFVAATPAATWHTCITAYSDADSSAQQLDGATQLPEDPTTDTLFGYAARAEPVLNTEDNYEGSGVKDISADPSYFYRRLFWAHLLSGGGATYGAQATWGANAYYTSPALNGLESLQRIPNILQQASVDLGLFSPKDQVIPRKIDATPDRDRWYEFNRVQVAVRDTKEILAYIPNDGYMTDPGPGVRRGATPAVSPPAAEFPGIKMGQYGFNDDNYRVTWYDPKSGLPVYATVVPGAKGNTGYIFRAKLPTPAPPLLTGDAVLHISSRCTAPNVCEPMDGTAPAHNTNSTMDINFYSETPATLTLDSTQYALGSGPGNPGSWRCDRNVPNNAEDGTPGCILTYIFPNPKEYASVDYYFKRNSKHAFQGISFVVNGGESAVPALWGTGAKDVIDIGFAPEQHVMSIFSPAWSNEYKDGSGDYLRNVPLASNRWYHLSVRTKVRKVSNSSYFDLDVYLDGRLTYSRIGLHLDSGDQFFKGVQLYTAWWGPIDDLPSTVGPAVWWDELTVDPPVLADQWGLYHTDLQQESGGYEDTRATYFDGAAGYDGSSFQRVGANNYDKSLLQFDTHNIPASAIIDEATLALYYAGRSNANTLTLGAHGVLADWNASTANRIQRQAGVNWNVAGMGAGSDYATTPAATLDVAGEGNSWVELDVTGLAQTWVADPAQNHGLVLLQEAASGFVVYDFCSEVAQAPATPEPPCVAGRAPKLTLRYHLVEPAPVKATFQRGAGGYTGNTATYFDGAAGYNSSPYLRVSADNTIKSLLRFDLTTIPITETVAEATLRVYPVTRTNANSLTLAAHPVLADWTDSQANRVQRQNGANWQVTGMGAGSDYAAEADGTAALTGIGSGWVELDVTDLAQAWVANPAENHGLVLLAQAASGSVNYGVCSELGWSPCTAAQAPALTIWHHPPPPTPEPEPEP